MTDEEFITKFEALIDARLEAFERRILAAIDRLAEEIRTVRAQVEHPKVPVINGGTV